LQYPKRSAIVILHFEAPHDYAVLRPSILKGFKGFCGEGQALSAPLPTRHIGAELHTFWSFLHRAYGMENAQAEYYADDKDDEER
jgi:hypothetical protein